MMWHHGRPRRAQAPSAAGVVFGYLWPVHKRGRWAYKVAAPMDTDLWLPPTAGTAPTFKDARRRAEDAMDRAIRVAAGEPVVAVTTAADMREEMGAR